MLVRDFLSVLTAAVLLSLSIPQSAETANRENIPRPEHPRPLAVRAGWLNLNGSWQFEFDDGNSGEARELHRDAPYAHQIMVPFCPESSLSGIGHKDFMPAVWYRRQFEVPEAWNGKRIILHFGAVDYEATVWVNDTQVADHRGGYSPFSCEISGVVAAGKNTVTLRARDDTRSGLQPRGKQCSSYESRGVHYTRTTGIWQTVWLEAVGTTYVASHKVFPDPDRGAVALQLSLRGDPSGLRVRATATLEGKPVGRTESAAAQFVSLDLPLRTKKLWEPGKPVLYDLTLEIIDAGGNTVDRLESYFGLRKIEIIGSRVLINGKPVFQRLVLDQGFYPDGIYTAPTDVALRRDVEMGMEMGFNGARLHQKVFEPRLLYWADRLGYLVWGEFPNWGLDHSDPRALERMLPEWLEVVARDFNHPSIVIWTPFNETPNNQNPELLRLIYLATKAADPTRPVHDTSGYVHVETDIFSVHNYQGDSTSFREDFEPFKNGGKIWQREGKRDSPYMGQPYIVDEYGGIWWNPGQRGTRAWGYGNRPTSEEEFLARYRALTETLLSNPRMFGFCYTQLTDIEQEVNGLYTYDRRAKFDPALIRAINSQKAAYEMEN